MANNKMTYTTAEMHTILESLNKHEASTRRLKAATTNSGVAKIYEQQLIDIVELRTKIITGQGDLLK
ncbi:MAG: hypothetical protein [Microvirus sp.]|nr:MAG: hypothetical protein [Microvirus sp.]